MVESAFASGSPSARHCASRELRSAISDRAVPTPDAQMRSHLSARASASSCDQCGICDQSQQDSYHCRWNRKRIARRGRCCPACRAIRVVCTPGINKFHTVNQGHGASVGRCLRNRRGLSLGVAQDQRELLFRGRMAEERGSLVSGGAETVVSCEAVPANASSFTSHGSSAPRMYRIVASACALSCGDGSRS